jgi:hypothetical protein
MEIFCLACAVIVLMFATFAWGFIEGYKFHDKKAGQGV